MLLSGADIIIRTLIEQGVNTVFGYPGGQILDVYESLYKYKDEINHVLVSHEQGAAHAADGYARTSGKVGVAIATSGPGATNLVTGIATAFLDSVPMVAICGNVPTEQLGTDGFQEIDITGITLPITKHNYIVGDVKKLADTIREAFYIAKSGRPGPVLIDVPKDIQQAKCEFIPQQPVAIDDKKPCLDIDLAVECINKSKRPLIFFGGGVISSGAEQEIIELSEAIDAPMCCTLMGISAVASNNPRFLGMQGMHGRLAASVAMGKSDCIIALGVRFSDRATGNKDKFAAAAQIIHIDIDSAEFSKNVKVSHQLKGDIKLTLQKLIPLLERKCRPEWIEKIERYKRIEKEHQDTRQGMTPSNIMSSLNKCIDPDMPIVTDVGQHQMWAAQMVNFSRPRRFVSSGGLGTMGFGMGAAVGAQYGTSERTVLITGDGSFSMSLNELSTAASNNLPIVILLLNNGVLGMVRQWQTLFFDKHYSHTILERKTDYVGLAKSLGADGVRVENINDLQSALKKAFSYNGTFLIECVIDKDELVLPIVPPGGSFDDLITKVGD